MTALKFFLRALIAWAPFHVIFSVFLGQKLGIPYVSAVKDILLVLLVLSVMWSYVRARRWPVWNWSDIFIALYIIWMILSSLWEGVGWRAIVVGARFDFQFLVAFLAARHAAPFLSDKISSYLKWFLVWGGIAVGLGMIVRFITHEDVLISLGWTTNLSNWQPGGAPPIWHGIPGANVRRFQGIFDGPNQTAVFLLGYLAAWMAFLLPSSKYRGWGFIGIAVLFGLITLTYTRSALVGLAVEGGVLAVWYLPFLWKKHRTQTLGALAILVLVAGMFWLRYEDRLREVFQRSGSTQGHFERMEIGWKQFLASPVTGHGLASSGPAVRLTGLPVPKEEKTFIPESWYVQQLVEGGFPALVLFCASVGAIFVSIWRSRPLLAGGFLAILVMNLLLHAFESAWAVIPFFLIVGIYAAHGKKSGIKSLAR